MIILMGVAGSGKSMQGRMLADEAGYPWLSTGELLRVLITGRRRHEMLTGKLLSDDEVINVVDTVMGLIDTSQRFVLDGFPRTIAQADWLLSKVNKKELKLTAIFHLVVSEEIVKERLDARARSDDNEGAIRNRFEEYRKMTVPILEHFKNAGITVTDIDASKSPPVIHAQIMDYLATIKNGTKIKI